MTDLVLFLAALSLFPIALITGHAVRKKSITSTFSFRTGAHQFVPIFSALENGRSHFANVAAITTFQLRAETIRTSTQLSLHQGRGPWTPVFPGDLCLSPSCTGPWKEFTDWRLASWKTQWPSRLINAQIFETHCKMVDQIQWGLAELCKTLNKPLRARKGCFAIIGTF